MNNKLVEQKESNIVDFIKNPILIKNSNKYYIFSEKVLQKLILEDIHFEVIASPGHTKGSCCYYLPEEKILFSGDTIFAESVGRTDLPTGNMGQLVRSVRKLLEMLPDDTLVYPGHAHSTSIEHEKRYNPFA